MMKASQWIGGYVRIAHAVKVMEIEDLGCVSESLD